MSPAPSLSLSLRNFAAEDPGSWEPLLRRARAADDAGVDRVVVADHVVFGERLDDYGRPELGGAEGGRQPTGPDGHWLEPLTVLTVIGAQTRRVRLMTGILLAPLRTPAVLAKQASTIDVLTGGRLDLGVGVGWQDAEYDANGLSFRDRGRLLDRTLEICQRLWRDGSAAYDDGEVAFERIHQMPKPVRPGGVPIWVSGRSTNARVVERVARYGAGWIPWGDDARDPRPGIDRMRAALAAAGRDPGALQVTASLPSDLDAVRDLAAAGVTDFRVAQRVEDDDLAALVTAFRASAS